MSSGAPHRKRFSWARLAFFFLFWLMVAGWSVRDLPVGAAAAGGALWISLKLSPSGDARVRAGPLFRLVVRLLRGSLVAGFDVARRALAPRPDLRPGFVSCPLTLPEGEARDVFRLLQSLMPGTLPTGVEEGRALVHGLDLSQPIAENFATEERLFKRAAGHE
ncbi:Na+/H+ antiporter subunit E [Rhodoblastus sp.]|uniref:Na+/H+ antiporter subunit E n=1 Tax=Rhodoblastus sp. TaxID=1962975 RepID=UPI002608EF6F|nr:Na+/H+ antiporter subunit E [Rhodoblastus sp.]